MYVLLLGKFRRFFHLIFEPLHEPKAANARSGTFFFFFFWGKIGTDINV